jgi:hypothetical protein
VYIAAERIDQGAVDGRRSYEWSKKAIDFPWSILKAGIAHQALVISKGSRGSTG